MRDFDGTDRDASDPNGATKSDQLADYSDDLAPIRLDFWSGESLRAFAASLARETPKTLPFFRPFRLRPRLYANQQRLLANYRASQAGLSLGGFITPAAEWLLDNHHIVEENFRHLRRDLSPDVYRNLPVMTLGDGTKIPRALALIWLYVALTNSTTEETSLTELVEGFQDGAILTIGELWAIPALLRLVVLENLRRLSDRVEIAQRLRRKANIVADQLAFLPSEGLERELDHNTRFLAEPTFGVQLMYRLRDGSNAAPRALAWLERHLQAQGTTPEQAIAQEHARQSSGNVTVGNIIRSLRRIDDIDWFAWVEKVSRVDQILRRDRDYPLLDKATRNAYREAVERIARRSPHDEVFVAEAAVAGQDPSDGAGACLLGAARSDFERDMGYRRRFGESLLASYRRLGWVGIFLPSLILTIAVGALMVRIIPGGGVTVPELILFAIALFPMSDAVSGVINRIGARLVPPQVLPAYDYTAGVPDEARTLVVIPCLLTGHDEIDTLVRSLEVHFLANPKGAVSFALLSDWTDCETETRPDDARLLAHAQNSIEALAARYANTGERRFFLLHRCRLFNKRDQVWMGWERKRGKLVELNQLLRGDHDTSFIDTGPRPKPGVRFVVTLDADTRLLRDTVPALVGKLAHPVNRPVADATTGRVTHGYGILQPRLTPSLAMGSDASLFQRIFSVDRGLDPYVFTTSDLYQDLLGEGSYTGKGIYDVDAFVAATEGHLPENAVLSHDLLEGSLARAALVSDVRFVEDFPVEYAVEAARQHRWTRGDWQLLPFVLNLRNALPALARLKMIDNLRRSLVAPAWVAAALIGWLTLPFMAALNWQLLLWIALFLPALLSVETRLGPMQPADSQLWYVGRLAQDVLDHLRAMVLRLTFLAHHAFLMLDAIFRTLFRLLVSRKNLLEWRTARQVAAAAKGSFADYLYLMAAAPILGLCGLALVAAINPQNLPIAAAVCLFWVLSPLVAWQASRTLEDADALTMSKDERQELRDIARTTWRFFETFVTPASHFLPPDNFQDTPEPHIAERTSPTNIGLYLLSVVSARAFGWISLNEAVRRLDQCLTVLDRLEKHRGHLFNWYDTATLTVLSPRYVSSVDSGNLAGHLISVAAALKQWASAPLVYLLTNPEGVADTLSVLRKSCAAIPDDRRILRPLRRRLEERIDGFARTHATYLDEPQLAPVRALGLSVAAEDIRQLARAYAAELADQSAVDLVWWCDALKANCEALISVPGERSESIAEQGDRLFALAERARAFAFAMDFGFLHDPEAGLLSIGCRTDENVLDSSHYDLLASEARLASLFAIAKGDLPNKHWFRLGRPVAAFGLKGALLSWSGSMFEYLMPPLVMHERIGGVLHESCHTAIARQIAYARGLGLPWGVSESAFSARDRALNYQYYAFGVPELGLKRVIADERVIAPYSSALAAQLRPSAAVANLKALAKLGALGAHGYFDAVDFTPRRLPEGQNHVVVRNVMAHHQGMTICALANAVMGGLHRDNFHADPVIQAAELLLQERAPTDIVPITRAPATDTTKGRESDENPIAQTTVSDPLTADTAVGILSNGALSAMFLATGAGSIRLGDRSLTRYVQGSGRHESGLFFFLRDLQTGRVWSASALPKTLAGEVACTIFSDHKVEFVKETQGIHSNLEVLIASEAQAIAHHLTLKNAGESERILDVTSYGEIVLDRDAADAAHPAFSKMFVKTEALPKQATIMAERKPRGVDDRGLHLAHMIAQTAEGAMTEAETDRRAFIGRGRDLSDAAAFDPGHSLSGADGHTLDPIFALRRRIRLMPGKEVQLTFWTIVAETREALDRARAHYCRAGVFEHESRLAWTQSQVQLRHLDTTLEEAALFRRFAAKLVTPDNRLSIPDPTIRSAQAAQSRLWAHGISGDVPIMILRIDTEVDLPIVRKTLRLHEFLRARGVHSDLVILNERAASYVQDLQSAIDRLIASGAQSGFGERARPCVFALRRDQIGEEDWKILLAGARIVLHARNGKLSEQLARLRSDDDVTERAQQAQLLLAAPDRRQVARIGPAFPDEKLRYFNGFGGFAEDGKSYVVRLRHGEATPHPWINVIGRKDFGFHVSAEGAGYTWSVNSRDHQITPWANDPVTNRVGEGFFLRERRTGRLATPFAALSDDPSAIYQTRHGLGFSHFLALTDWLRIDAVQVLAKDGPAKLTELTLTNLGETALDLDCVAFADLVLGQDPTRTAAAITFARDDTLGALTARNLTSNDFGRRVTALAVDLPLASVMTSHRSFFGIGNRLARPKVLTAGWPRVRVFDDRPGDPCAVIATRLHLSPGETRKVTFALADDTAENLAATIRSALQPGGVAEALAASRAEWEDFTTALQVETPDDKLDLLVNTWLPYQALSCRIRARSAFYQASGAYGFRDQLQDSAALLLHDKHLARAQLIEAAGRQFVEGDVQHWWLPATGAGVRTTISDDVVWLAHLTAHYVKVTGDAAILDTNIGFLRGPALEPGRHDAFFTPDANRDPASLYLHCTRALDLALSRLGPRGLPLILGGDWNDGMNRVGEKGQGESVWLAWFLIATLDQFAPLARARGDERLAQSWLDQRAAILAALENVAWDGAWYQRGSFDDGTPLGSASSEECRIDSIAQSWAVLSGAADPVRASQAIDSALAHLADVKSGLLRLFTPPFDKTLREPGYIKAYPPGVRENGGQYTHAAAWLVYALGKMGRGAEAKAMFDLINPINHALSREDAERYRVEPYVVAADVYDAPDKAGRGGWTWYTGSAGWIFRTAVESILGITQEDGRYLRVTPCLPPDWPGFRAHLRRDGTRHEIVVTQVSGRVAVRVNGQGPDASGRFDLGAESDAETGFVPEAT